MNLPIFANVTNVVQKQSLKYTFGRKFNKTTQYNETDLLYFSNYYSKYCIWQSFDMMFLL